MADSSIKLKEENFDLSTMQEEAYDADVNDTTMDDDEDSDSSDCDSDHSEYGMETEEEEEEEPEGEFEDEIEVLDHIVNRAGVGKDTTPAGVDRVPGGKPVQNKPVVLPLDEEDQLILDLKRQGYTNEEVRDRLLSEGFSSYKASSIYARFTRLEEVLREKQSKALETKGHRWNAEEDRALFNVYDKIDDHIQRDLNFIYEKRFLRIAKALNGQSSHPKFTANICRARYEELLHGVEESAVNDDATDDDEDDQEDSLSHRKKVYEDTKRLEEKAARQCKSAAAAKKEVARVALKDKAEAKKQQLALTKAQTKNSKEAERKRYKADRDRVLELWEREKERERQRKEEFKRDAQLLKQFAREKRLSTSTEDSGPSKRRMSQPGHGYAQSSASRIPDNLIILRQPPTSQALFDDPDTDPREIMAKCELLSLVCERGMTKNREKETKGLLNRRIRESDRTANLGDIKEWLQRRGLPCIGNRADMLWRLAEYDATRSRSWRPKHMAVLDKGRKAVQHLFSAAETGGAHVMLPRPSRGPRTTM